MAQKSYLFVTHIAKTGNFCSLNINYRLDRTVVDADDIGDALWRYGLRLRRKYNIELDSASYYYPVLATTLDDNMSEGVVILYGKKTTEDEAGNSFEGKITLAVRIAEAKYLDDKDINVDRCLFDRLDQIVNTRFDEYADDLRGGLLFAPLNGAKVTGYAQPRDKNIDGSESDTPIAVKIDDRWIVMKYAHDGLNHFLLGYIPKPTLDESVWDITEINGYIAVNADEGVANICDPAKMVHIVIRQDIRSERGPVCFLY